MSKRAERCAGFFCTYNIYRASCSEAPCFSQPKASKHLVLLKNKTCSMITDDHCVVVCRNIIHGSDGPETAKDEINLWFKPEELNSYTSNQEKWVYGVN